MKHQIISAQQAAAQTAMTLLLQADPNPKNVQSYLKDSLIYASVENQNIIAICVAKEIQKGVIEIFNVSVDPKHQQKGIGSDLLKYVLNQLKLKGFTQVELGTGSFGYQLTFYQRLGFRVEKVLKNHFIEHYPEPIFEQGIQLKDMLRLSFDLNK